MVRVSYIEIYNEELNDLLRPDNTNLRVFEDAVMGSYVKDLTEVAVCTAEDTLRLLARGNEYRHVSATAMNAKSSRSHTLFRMAVETRSNEAASSVTDTDSSVDNMSELTGASSFSESKTEETLSSRSSRKGASLRRYSVIAVVLPSTDVFVCTFNCRF